MTGNAQTAAVWAGVDRLLDRADGPALVFHRLEPLAARRLRELGRRVPEELAEAERLVDAGDTLEVVARIGAIAREPKRLPVEERESVG